MRQVVQNIRTGRLTVATVPEPLAQPGHVLIANERSLVSAGTERMAMDLARKSLLGKARERPDHVRRVIEKARSEGLLNTIAAVRQKLDEPMAMGYSSAGVVLACGAGVQEYKPGDRVASNGPHAGVVCVPRHLCARIPDSVGADQAAFAVLGAVALQGIRLARLGLGETAVVIGLGLIGQITVALLRAHGCRVLGTDPDRSKCELAERMGASLASPDLSQRQVEEATRGLLADAVLIAASTKSDAPLAAAAELVRQKGRVVAVGAVGMNLPRRPFYFKEAELVVSCSYGPGRYDPEYEERGRDYPAAHVRWTEQRNMQAVLDLMGAGGLDLGPLITHRFPIEKAESAYALIESRGEPYLGILLMYPGVDAPVRKIEMSTGVRTASGASIPIGCLGSGNFARMVLLPALEKVGGFRPRSICSARGLSAVHAAEKMGFEIAATDEDEVIGDPEVKAVFILTRHDLHAGQVVKALRAGKHVFVEKPLAIDTSGLRAIEIALSERGADPPLLMVGFNRRFSPMAREARAAFSDVTAPLTVSIRFNAGPIPADHWTQDAEVGGGRIIGEACHGIDLAAYLTGSPPVRVFAESIGGPSAPKTTDDQCFITIRHANGSVSSIAYLSGGDKAFPKERIEILGGGRIAVIDDFRSLVLSNGGKRTRRSAGGQDKGHRAEIEAFARALRGEGPPPIPWSEIRSTTLASFLAVQSIREGAALDVL